MPRCGRCAVVGADYAAIVVGSDVGAAVAARATRRNSDPENSSSDQPRSTAPQAGPIALTGVTSPTEASVFGRPEGVSGSFDESKTPFPGKPQPTIAAPDPVLAEAFGRPADSDETLQRDPDARYGVDDEPEADPDPWRDPDSPASLTAPALNSASAPSRPFPGPNWASRMCCSAGIAWSALVTLAVLHSRSACSAA